MHLVARWLAACASRSIDWRRLKAMTGIITLRSKFDPSALAQAIVASLPTTCAATIITASGMTGLTLPGMIELPG